MKRFRTIFVAMALAAGAIAGCGGEGVDDSDAELYAEDLSYEQELTDEQIAAIEQLEKIGYLGGASAYEPERVGITILDRNRVFIGLNLYSSGHAPSAILMDMEGNRLYQWRHSFQDAFPEIEVSEDDEHLEVDRMLSHWRRVHLFPNGDVLAIFEGVGMIKVDKDSNLIWARSNTAHHDLEVMEDGSIYTLSRRAAVFPHIRKNDPVMVDYILKLDAEGNPLERISIWDAMADSEFAGHLERIPNHGDIMHTNTLEILDGRLADRVPAFAAGNALVSIRAIDTIAVIDMQREKAVWAMAGDWVMQHQPTALDNGNLLLFDNRGGPKERGISRVLELNPATGEVVWMYEGTADDPFDSGDLGSAERLPNGNTLITESRGGRAFEVTPEKEKVWEFVTPHRWGKYGERSASINEMLRLPPDFPTDWIEPDDSAPAARDDDASSP